MSPYERGPERDYVVFGKQPLCAGSSSKERARTRLDVVINDSQKKLIFEMRVRASWSSRQPDGIDA